MEHWDRASLRVAEPLVRFVEDEALLDFGISAASFWDGLDRLIHDLSPANRQLLDRREELQSQLDDYHDENPGVPDPVRYRPFLEKIGYLLPEPSDFSITTDNVDPEVASQAGPQLVVPLLNKRFAANASNARWGSLYDALYGTDAVGAEGDLRPTGEYNPRRGAEVIARGRALLDLAAPLITGSHVDSTEYRVEADGLAVTLADGSTTRLSGPDAFAGYRGAADRPTTVLLVHHGLHVEIVFDSEGNIGRTDAAAIQDIVLESAVTTIMDLEDSVAAVDADDKVLGYRNWLHLMRGTLSEEVTKGGRTFTRTLNPDREYSAPAGGSVVLPGRSLLFIRNVGHLMTTDAVLDASGQPVFEGILDAALTALGSLGDLRGESTLTNSRTGSMYIVKPKMHGPEEVAFAVTLFSRVEELLGLPERTIKIGIMDEERRTTVNLRACIAAAKERVVFINTGFLDRTGDEIHTSMRAGAVVRKADIRKQPFIRAYENSNVDAGLGSGFAGRAQIGKGMWAMPDLMRDMLNQKIAHPLAGATAAWVPSPTAATLHALHYHEVDTVAVQRELSSRTPQSLEPILVPPLSENLDWTADERREELDNNVQSILGYVVRWIDQGIGCSKVPDIHDVALMEDRATLRISSQLLANWLMHGVVDQADVIGSLERLSPVVDAQNAADPAYEPLIGPDGPGLAFQAARELILDGASQPNGYTEPILHRIRRQKKASR